MCLLDIQMPVMDGLEAARELRRRGMTRIRLVALTADVTTETREACAAVGIDEYLSKPVKLDALSAVLARAEAHAAPADAPAAPTGTPGTLGTYRHLRHLYGTLFPLSLFAAVLHIAGWRGDMRFITVLAATLALSASEALGATCIGAALGCVRAGRAVPGQSAGGSRQPGTTISGPTPASSGSPLRVTALGI